MCLCNWQKESISIVRYFALHVIAWAVRFQLRKRRNLKISKSVPVNISAPTCSTTSSNQIKKYPLFSTQIWIEEWASTLWLRSFCYFLDGKAERSCCFQKWTHQFFFFGIIISFHYSNSTAFYLNIIIQEDFSISGVLVFLLSLDNISCALVSVACCAILWNHY